MESLNKEVILDFLRENKKYLEKEFGVTEIALFGSYARDEATSESDIDILMNTNIRTFKNRFLLKEFLEKHLSKEVNVTSFRSLRTFIRRSVEKDLIYA